jgi:hypothetical protein
MKQMIFLMKVTHNYTVPLNKLTKQLTKRMKYMETPAGCKARLRPHRAKPEEAQQLPAESVIYFRSDDYAITRV